VRALLEMLGTGKGPVVVRLYRIDFGGGQLQLTLTTWSEGGTSYHEEIECDLAAAPPPMRRALEAQRVGRGMLSDADGRALNFVWVPVLREKELLGCVEIGMRRAPTQRQMMLVEGMRGLYGNYLSLLRYSQVDTLTQLLNRKTFDDSLQQLLTAAAVRPLAEPARERRHEAKRHDNWLAVLDIDHFKRVNDSFGHLFGDEVLILIANVMRKVFRRKDKLFRFGGEEFVVLLRDSNEENAVRVFERFRRTIEDHSFPQLGNVTVSIGFTRVRASDSPTTLLGRADDALYYAKTHGRNQSQFYDRLVAAGEISQATVVHTVADLF
jgi:diguanylate cyclase (GGDEF)-like protein